MDIAKNVTKSFSSQPPSAREETPFSSQPASAREETPFSSQPPEGKNRLFPVISEVRTQND